MKADIVYESKGKSINGEPYITVKRARGYYEYVTRAGTDSIAFILHKDNKIGLIYESKPPLDERTNSKAMLTTAFGGSIDSNKELIDICKTEVLEEAGFDVSYDRIKHIGKTMVSTQMDQFCYGFIVDVNNLEAGLTEADYINSKDPDEYCHNKVIWLTEEELIQNSDWKSIWIWFSRNK